MLGSNLVQVSIAVSSLLATSFALPQMASDSYVDYPATRALRDAYWYDSYIPKALNDSIGTCNFIVKVDPKIPFLVPLFSAQPQFDGKDSGYLLDRGTSYSNDTCLHFRGNIAFFFTICVSHIPEKYIYIKLLKVTAKTQDQLHPNVISTFRGPPYLVARMVMSR